jgi:hypothetical protein
MGCGGSREKETGINAPLNHWMDTIGVDSIDEVFSNASPVIKELEEIREIVVDRRDDVIIHTGACAHKEPNISKCFQSLLWKLSADNEGDIGKAEIEVLEDAPYLAIKGKKNSHEGSNAGNLFIRYCNDLMTLPEKMNALSEKIQNLAEEIGNQAASFGEQITEFAKDHPLKIPGMLSKLSRNVARVKAAAAVSPDVAKELTSTIAQIKDVGDLLKATDKVDEIGKKAHKEKQTHAHVIVFTNLKPEERWGNQPTEGVQRFENKKKAKAEEKKQK